MTNLPTIFLLLCVLGFLVGFVAGYFLNGVYIESSCKAHISSLNAYIERVCPSSSNVEFVLNSSVNLSEVFV